MALISQSTQPPWKFEKLAAFMVGRSHELKIVNTVCPVTIRRQEDTLEAARNVDLMVVVGGRSSANTKELTRLCGIAGTAAIQIEGVRDLDDPTVFDGTRVVGVTGGTSTPIEDLRDVARRVLELAGTPEVAARAEELAVAALSSAATPGRPDDVAAARYAPDAHRVRRRVGAPAMNALPIVAIVGRPNVGKSTLFNRILGSRTAIVEDRARTTRDRLYGDAEWNGRRFIVVDTGGLEVDPDDPIEAKVQEQARLAIAEADVIVLVVDAAVGITPSDQEAAVLLRRATRAGPRGGQQGRQRAARVRGRRVLRTRLGRDPSDQRGPRPGDRRPARRDRLGAAARERGGDRPQGARDRGRRVGPRRRRRAPRADPERPGRDRRRSEDDADLTPADIEARKWDAAIAADADRAPAAIAFVGRPNVGKSSLLNALLGEDRAIVSEIPGTTRDAIDTRLAWGRSEVVLIDTAGIKRRGKVASGPAAEKYSTLRALKAIGRADVAILVIDAVEGLTGQDAHVAGYVVEEGKGLVVAINKWDLVAEKTDKTFEQYVEWIRHEVPFLDFAPVISISAKTGQRVGRVLEAAVDIWGERRRRVSTGELNRMVAAASERQLPPIVKGRRPKIFYATQAAVAPPTFVFFANDAGVGPLQLPALPREPPARHVRVRRHAAAPRVPRPERGQAAAAQEGERTGRAPAGGGPAGRADALGRAEARHVPRPAAGRGSGPPEAVTPDPVKPDAGRGDGSDRLSRGAGPGRRRRRRGVGHDAGDAARPHRAGHALVPHRGERRAHRRRPAATSCACPGSISRPASGRPPIRRPWPMPISSSSPCPRPTCAR